MIDYGLLAQSIGYYENNGFKRIEAPWTVSAATDDITKPADRIHMQLKHNDKCLVGSGEQSFLYLYAKDYLPKGRYQTVTPCWRYEAYDGKFNLALNDIIKMKDANKRAFEDGTRH